MLAGNPFSIILLAKPSTSRFSGLKLKPVIPLSSTPSLYYQIPPLLALALEIKLQIISYLELPEPAMIALRHCHPSFHFIIPKGYQHNKRTSICFRLEDNPRVIERTCSLPTIAIAQPASRFFRRGNSATKNSIKASVNVSTLAAD